jgi:hypothetical protein
MPKICARAEAPTEQAPFSDNGTAHARSDREHGHVLHTSASTETVFSPASSVGIVVDRHIERNSLLQASAKWLVSPVNVRGVVHGRLLGVYETCGSDPRRDNLVARRQPLNHRNDDVGYGRGIASRSGLSILRDDFAGLRYESSSNLRSANVYTDRVHECRV